MKLKAMHIQSFKGFRDLELVFDGNNQIISGRNGVGKTTIADAYYWVVVDKDASLKSSPEVHPDFMEESEPSVTLVCDLNGKEVTLRKFQKDSRTQKQKEENAPVRISNQYEVNAVPKSQKDFVAYLEENGIAINNLLLLSHPDIFMGQKTADCRSVLFGMVNDITDADIAKDIPNCEDAGMLLESYTVEEIAAMKKKEKKESDENIEAIPNQIIGMENSKVAIAVEEFTRQRETLVAEIEAIESDIAENAVPSVGELNQKLVLLEKQEHQLTAEANAERVEKLTNINAEIGELKTTLNEKAFQLKTIKSNIADNMDNKTSLEQSFQRLKEDFEKTKAKEYVATDTKCPYCGQELPVHRLDEAKAHFDKEKQESLDDINRVAKDTKDKIGKLDAEIKEQHTVMTKLDAEVIELEKQIEAKVSVRAPLEHATSVSGTEEHQKIMEQILAVRHEIAQRDSLVEAEDAKRAEVKQKQQVIREIDEVLGQAKNNDRIDEQIVALKAKQKEYAQVKANAEKILYQLQLISRKKNELLTEQVNSHFKRVKWRLFKYQKNGEVVDDCTPMVLTSNGEYRDATYSANTAAIELAKLDIINGLQEFYGQRLPVFLDGAECLDDESKKQISMDTQLIMMCVDDDELKVRSM